MESTDTGPEPRLSPNLTKRVDSWRTVRSDSAQGPVVTVPIASLLPGESPRLNGQDAAHVARLAEVENPLPPILVERETLQVIDGMHRLLAATLAGREEIDVVFYDGSDGDTFLRAVEANVQHGFPLSRADRRAAATRIIASHPGLSDRAIARISGLGAKTVAEIRLCTDDDGQQLNARIGRDGRTRPLDPLEGRRRAAELLTERPDASLREIARAAGVSPTTAGDVRRRLELGEPPIPAPRSEQHAAGAAPAARPSPPARRIRVVVRPVPRSMMDQLLRDPALRHHDGGRRLLRLLHLNARGHQEFQELVTAVPAHCIDIVGELAQNYAQMWSTFAEELSALNQPSN